MNKIPSELWFVIASFASRRDLPSLARVSVRFLEASRQVMYQEVAFSDNENLDQTLLLLRNSALARRIEKFTVRDMPERDNIPVDHTIIYTMPNLRSLSIICCPSFLRASKDRKIFMDKLPKSCPHLREILYEDGRGPHSDDFAIPNIVRIGWTEPGGFTRPLLSLCRASSSTITHLSVPVTLDTFGVESVLAFSKLKFPRLLSLELGPWKDIDGSPEMPVAITQFLLSHPSIEHLHMIYTPAEGDDALVVLDRGLASSDILPNLKSLDAHPYTIRQFVKIRAGFLSTLSSLSLSHGLSSDGNLYFARMLQAFMEYDGAFPNVLNMTFYLQNGPTTYTFDASDLFDRMSAISTIFSGLETWTGDVPADMTLGMFIRIFSKFRRLRVLDLTGWPTHNFEGLGKTDTVRSLADECVCLQMVKFRRKDGVLVDALSVSRDEEGGLSLRWRDIDNYE